MKKKLLEIIQIVANIIAHTPAKMLTIVASVCACAEESKVHLEIILLDFLLPPLTQKPFQQFQEDFFPRKTFFYDSGNVSKKTSRAVMKKKISTDRTTKKKFFLFHESFNVLHCFNIQLIQLARKSIKVIIEPELFVRLSA
jgi:hypothetical protein